MPETTDHSPRRWWRDDRRVWRVALVAGLLIRLILLYETRSLGTTITDEQEYSRLATNLAHGNGFAWGADQPTSIRPPLYPAIVAGIWRVMGSESLQAVRIVQIALALLSAWLVLRIGRAAFSDRVGRYGAAVFWLYPSFIFFNVLILTETVFTLLLVLFVWLLVRLLQAPRAGLAIACGLALGLAALSRSILWPLPILLCPLLALLLRAPVRTRVVVPVLLLLGYIAVVAPWAVRNSRLQHTFVVVDTMGGINLRMGNYEYTPDDRMWDAVSLKGDKNWVHGLDVPGVPTEGQKEKWAQRKAIDYIKANPGTTLRRAFIKFADFWGLEREFIAGVQKGMFSPPMWFVALATLLSLAAYAAVAILGVAGVFLGPPAWRAHVLILLPGVVIMGLHTIVFAHSRYHMPIVPILGLYAASFLTTPRSVWRGRRLAIAGAALGVVILVAIWLREILIVDADRIRAVIDRVF